MVGVVISKVFEAFTTAPYSLPMAKKMSFTFMPVLAEVSMNSSPFSSAYCFASSNSTTRMFDKSALLPASAMTMFGEAWKKVLLIHILCNIIYVSSERISRVKNIELRHFMSNNINDYNIKTLCTIFKFPR